ncbi:MAG: hypothetical protein ABI461_21685, partial [Polyangiaceae bacterium]
MAEQVRQPVAIRVMRPYSSEEAFLEHEIETLTRTSIVLVGAQSRPQGVVLRFEVVLENGASLLRGEGRVVAHKQNAFGDSPGLTLRFTRLDTRSKTLIDKAAAIRDAKARAALDASMTGSAAPPSRSTPPASVRPPASRIPVDLTPPPIPVSSSAKAPSVAPVAVPSPMAAPVLARSPDVAVSNKPSVIPTAPISEPILV